MCTGRNLHECHIRWVVTGMGTEFLTNAKILKKYSFSLHRDGHLRLVAFFWVDSAAIENVIEN